MEMNGPYLLVEMDWTHNKVFNLGGLELVRPDQWELPEEETVDQGRKYDVNRDLRQTNPQIATVLAGNMKNRQIKPGQQVFLHYLACDSGEPHVFNGKDCLAVKTFQVFFIIHGEHEYEMVDDLYLGEQVYSEQEQTASGIFLTSGMQKEATKVRITHIPNENAVCKIGDVVVSIDDYQYTLDIHGKQYIKLKEHEITGIMIDNEFVKK